MTPEQRFSPMDEEFAMIGMASTFFGREFVNDRIGYENAIEALRCQVPTLRRTFSTTFLASV